MEGFIRVFRDHEEYGDDVFVNTQNFDTLKLQLTESTFPLVGVITNIMVYRDYRERKKTLFLIADYFEKKEEKEKMIHLKKMFRDTAENFKKNACFAILPINDDTSPILQQYLTKTLSLYQNFPILVRISDKHGDVVLDQDTDDIHKIVDWIHKTFSGEIAGTKMNFAKEDL